MEPGGGRREKLPPPPLVLPPAKGKEGSGSSGGNARLEKAKQRSAQQELKQRQRAEVGGGLSLRRPLRRGPN